MSREGIVEHDELDISFKEAQTQPVAPATGGLFSRAFKVGDGAPPVDWVTLARVACVVQVVMAPYLFLFEACGFRLAFRSLQDAMSSRQLFAKREFELATRASHSAGRLACTAMLLALVLFLAKLGVALAFILKYL